MSLFLRTSRSILEDPKLNYRSKISARPAEYDLTSRKRKSWAVYQNSIDESIGSSEGSSETENIFDASFSPNASVKSRRDRFLSQFIKGMVDLIDSKLASCSFQTHTNEGKSASQHSRASSVSFRSQDVASYQNNSCKRKRKKHDEGDDDEDEEDLPPKLRGSSAQADGADGRDFACHFFKHNPQKYSEMKRCRCSTAGWRSIHRLK